ncbi:MAG: helix-turn-helix domain-containing protein [Kiloniellales bacterium]|nr:helix-turn-helix domain-containing protein [Kiloniellales bacterium]
MDGPLPVTLVVGPRFSFVSLAICMDGLRIANRESLRPVYDWIIASESAEPVVSSSGPAITPQTALRDIAVSPVSIVLTAYEPEAACTPGLLAWLRRQDRQGGIIACVDTAALVLARAGLLKGERIAVHHEVVAPFREEIGDAVLPDRRFAFEGRRLSGAGGIATLEMLLAFIESTGGATLSRRVAHALNFQVPSSEVAVERAALPSGISGIDRRLGRLVAIMQTALETPLAVAEICRRARVEESTARRLFHRHLGQSPSAYYLRLRLERARNLLRYSHLSIAEIATAVGFADAPSFSHAFKRVFEIPPSRARQHLPGR